MADTYGAKSGTRVADSYPEANGWDNIAYVASDATTTGQSLVDVTGLVLNILAGAVYEFEATLQVVASADTNGMEVGLHTSQTLVSVQAIVDGNTATTTAQQKAIVAADTATAAFNTSSGGVGIIRIRGMLVGHATIDGTFSVQHLKVTSGTSTVKKGSSLKIRKVA